MKYVVFIYFAILLVGCQHVERAEKPTDLIPEATMVQLLSEIYLGNASRSIDNKQVRDQGIKLDSFLFKKYKIDSLQFARSNAYYASNLEKYKSIFEKIQTRLEVLKQEENDRKLKVNQLKKEKLKQKDSLSEIKAEMDTTKTDNIKIRHSEVLDQQQ